MVCTLGTQRKKRRATTAPSPTRLVAQVASRFGKQMAVVQISQTTPQPNLQFSSTDELFLRAWYSNTFLASDGVTSVQSGNGQSGFYYNIECSINGDGNLVIPAFDVQATTASNPTALFTGQLFVNGAPDRVIFGTGSNGWPIPTIYGDVVTYDELARYAGTIFLVYPPLSFFTATEVIEEIRRLAGNFMYAAVGVNGIGQPSVAPDVASEPIFFGVNDPAVGNMHGDLSIGRVPRALYTDTVEDGQIQDDDTDGVSIQILTPFQAGDWEALGNNSYIDVSDDDGVANLFAGSDAQAQYAGVAAMCGGGDAEVFVQSTDYTNLYGNKAITKMGDGDGENNGTVVEVDDDARLIKLTNVPTSDPAVLGAIWSDSGVLKISAG